MRKRFILFFVLLLALAGCANLKEALNADSPGRIPAAGGHLQLLFSNPEYADAKDPLVKQQILENQIWDRRSGSMTVLGGVGLMQVWSF